MRRVTLTSRRAVVTRPHRARTAAFAATVFMLVCPVQIGCTPATQQKVAPGSAPAASAAPVAAPAGVTSGLAAKPAATSVASSATAAATAPLAVPAAYSPPRASTTPLPNDGTRLTHNRIRSIARGTFENMSRCYSDALARDPQTQGGRINVMIAIADDGEVLSANAQPVAKRQPKGSRQMVTDPQVRSCVENHFKSLRFPPTNRGIMNMIYPVDFSIE